MDDHSTLHRSSCQDGDAARSTAKEPRLSTRHVADFIQAHRDELSRFIVRKLGTETEASDILHDAFLRLSERQTAEAIDNPRAFVFRIIANLIVDFQRRSTNRLPHETDEAVSHTLPENRPGPETRYQQQQRLEAINRALMELPEACRLAFYLNREEGYSHAEIAARLHISENMVAKHLARAMQPLPGSFEALLNFGLRARFKPMRCPNYWSSKLALDVHLHSSKASFELPSPGQSRYPGYAGNSVIPGISATALSIDHS